jgi:hypothetical protein
MKSKIPKIMVMILFAMSLIIAGLGSNERAEARQWSHAYFVYGSGSTTAGNAVVQTPDGGHIIAGEYQHSTGDVDGMLLKVNMWGSGEWMKLYGSTGYDTFTDIQLTSDGGYVVAGNTVSYGAGAYDVWVLKLNANGDVGTGTWQKTYGGGNQDWANTIQQTSDGGYVVAGYTTTDIDNLKELWVLKLNANGDVGTGFSGTWQKTYGGGGNEEAFAVQQTSDGSYIVAGFTTSFGYLGSSDWWVLKLDANGNVGTGTWQKVFGGGLDDYAYDVKQTTDGGYIVAGKGIVLETPRGILFKLNSDGTIDWQSAYGGATGESWFNAIQETNSPNIGYVVAGRTSVFGAGGFDAWILRVNEDGNVGTSYPGTWQNTFGFASGDEVALSLQWISDYGFVMTGVNQGPGGSAVWVSEVDCIGEIPGCSYEGDSDVTVVGLGEIDRPDTTVTGIDTSINGLVSAVTPVYFPPSALAYFPYCGAQTLLIDPTNASYLSIGGAGTINISLTNWNSCGWYVESNASWLVLNGGGEGVGNLPCGTSYCLNAEQYYLVAANTTGIPRTGTILIDLQTFTVNQAAGCTVTVNPAKTTIPYTGGSGYTASVMASDSTCAWSVDTTTLPLWITTSGGSGTGDGVITFEVQANTGSTRDYYMNIAGETLSIVQADSNYVGDLQAPTGEISPGSPIPLAITLKNQTTQPINIIRPDCCNTFTWVTDLATGIPVNAWDLVCRPYGIEDDLIVMLPTPAGDITLNCDLSERYPNLAVGSYNVLATYKNSITDPDYNATTPNHCRVGADRTQCYHIDTVVIPSNQMTINIAGTEVQSSPENRADLSFNPNQWSSQWASSSGLSIAATISNISGGNLVDEVDMSSIILNGTVQPLSVNHDDANQTLMLQFDAQQAVMSLGSLPPSINNQLFMVYPKIQFLIGNKLFTAQSPVTIVANTNTGLFVRAEKHIIGSGSKPPVNKVPIIGMKTRVYDKNQGSCAASKGISWQNYPAIWSECSPFIGVTGMTDGNGQVTFILDSGDYIVIGEYIEAGKPPIYIGVSVGVITPGSVVNKYLQVLQTSGGNYAGKYKKLTGSELLIIEPEYVEWDSNQELYPFVFASTGDWGVVTSVSPPEGFVADYENLAIDVTDAVKAVQFAVTDIGSKWVSTDVIFDIKHKGKNIKIKDKIGLKLSKKLAKQKGLGEFGEEE